MMSEGDPPGDDDSEGGGYGRPPKATRFKNGQRGNPTGRPRGRREPPYEAVLGQMVTIRENGVERRVTQEEAFLLQLAKSGVEGGGVAARTALNLIEEITARSSTPPALYHQHRPHDCGTRERHISTDAAANGQET